MVTSNVFTYYTEPKLPVDQDDNIILCGPGYRYQYNMQQTDNPTFAPFAVTEEGEPMHDAELAKLAADMNREFSKRASKVLEAKRTAISRQDLELTACLTERGLVLAYDVPHRKQRRAAPPPQRIIGQWLLRPISRAWYRMFP